MTKFKIIFLTITSIFVLAVFSFSNFKREDNNFYIPKNLNELNLISHKGEKITKNKIIKLPSVFFFGFLNCPDICPNTLYEISEIITKLGKDSNKVNFFFVTVDPERDKVLDMKEYLSNFNKNIIGISGNPKSVEKFLKSLYIYYEKIYIDDGFYTMDHSSQLFIFKKKGKFFGTISLEENEEIIIEKIKNVF